MNTTVQTQTQATTDLASIAIVGLIGLAFIFITGIAQASVLHDSAHDVRHAIGFACH